jgi:hypothetical protein
MEQGKMAARTGAKSTRCGDPVIDHEEIARLADS